MEKSRKNKEDILRDWFIYRENCLDNSCAKENEYNIYFDDIFNKIVKNTKENKKEYMIKELRHMENKLMEYTAYLEEQKYKNGFIDGIKLMIEVFETTEK